MDEFLKSAKNEEIKNIAKDLEKVKISVISARIPPPYPLGAYIPRFTYDIKQMPDVKFKFEAPPTSGDYSRKVFIMSDLPDCYIEIPTDAHIESVMVVVTAGLFQTPKITVGIL
jgi:hypothetical protein